MTQLVYLNVLISLYEFNIWLDGYIWWKFCVNSPLRNPLTDKNADVSNTYFPRCNLFGAVWKQRGFKKSDGLPYYILNKYVNSFLL